MKKPKCTQHLGFLFLFDMRPDSNAPVVIDACPWRALVRVIALISADARSILESDVRRELKQYSVKAVDCLSVGG